ELQRPAPPVFPACARLQHHRRRGTSDRPRPAQSAASQTSRLSHPQRSILQPQSRCTSKLNPPPLRSEGGESRCYRGRARSARAFACLPPFRRKGGANANAREARRGGWLCFLHPPAAAAATPFLWKGVKTCCCRSDPLRSERDNPHRAEHNLHGRSCS